MMISSLVNSSNPQFALAKSKKSINLQVVRQKESHPDYKRKKRISCASSLFAFFYAIKILVLAFDKSNDVS
jgi:hypothetical protein